MFQKDLKISNDTVLEEFNSMVNNLRNNYVRVIVMPSRQNIETPDSIFHNNWFSLYMLHKSMTKNPYYLSNVYKK
ncbi:MAG: arginine deiminase-related protein [Arsenophonus sp. NEOnobi-MAG3]